MDWLKAASVIVDGITMATRNGFSTITSGVAVTTTSWITGSASTNLVTSTGATGATGAAGAQLASKTENNTTNMLILWNFVFIYSPLLDK
jgi:hypothetical protein